MLRGYRVSRQLLILAVLVTGGAVAGLGGVAVAHAAETTGAITGRLTEGGAPVPCASVELVDADYNYIDSTMTGLDGKFGFTEVPEGEYRVGFRLAGGLEQWYSQQRSFWDATPVPVTAGQTVTLDEALRPYGSIAGRVMKADGTPAAEAIIEAPPVHGDLGMGLATADADGYYTLRYLDPGEYIVSFRLHWEAPAQYAHNATAYDDATPIPVTAGAVTAVGPDFPCGGTISGRVTDNGEPAAGITVSVTQVGGEYYAAAVTDDDGFYSVSAVVGTYTVSFGRDGLTQYAPQQAEVQSGGTMPIVLPLVRGAVVAVTDAGTGAAVANACVELVNTRSPYTLGNPMQPSLCSDANGHVRIDQIAPGDYKVFVWANDGVHGHQWVGKRGGVGKFKAATTIKLKAGQTKQLGTIKLDPAGTITGTATDELTGEPVKHGIVGFSTYESGIGVGRGQYAVDSRGNYTVGGVGPYAWTLHFSARQHAAEWSGDAVHRDRAAGIVVRPGETTVYDAKLGAGTVVSGHVYGPTGVEVDDALITFYNAGTGDEVAASRAGGSQPTMVAHLLGKQRVKVKYYAVISGLVYQGWVGGDSFDNADTFKIRLGGEVTLDVTVTVTQTYP